METDGRLEFLLLMFFFVFLVVYLCSFPYSTKTYSKKECPKYHIQKFHRPYLLMPTLLSLVGDYYILFLRKRK